jgi:RNase P subunit RPR2
MRTRKPKYERTTVPCKGLACEDCGRVLGKGKPVRMNREEVNEFRGDDVMHWCCPQCYAKRKERGE